jgi:hypothetical protein
LLLIIIVEKNGSQKLPHVPLDKISQHAKEDVGTHALGKAMMDGADLEVDGFQTAERRSTPDKLL